MSLKYAEIIAWKSAVTIFCRMKRFEFGRPTLSVSYALVFLGEVWEGGSVRVACNGEGGGGEF